MPNALSFLMCDALPQKFGVLDGVVMGISSVSAVLR
jgi:hypothetical protein